MTRILIGVPSSDDVKADFAMSLAALMGQTTLNSIRRPIKIALANHKGSVVMEARRTLADAAVNADVDYLLFLDADMTFPPDTLSRLLAHKKPFVGASYVKRDGSGVLLGKPLLGEVRPTFSGSLLLPMAHIPLGCCLIQTSLLKVLPRPWFRYITTEAGTTSEDTYFCALVREANETVWCDHKLTGELGHIGTHIHRVT